MAVREIILSLPKFRSGEAPAVEVIQVTHESVKIRLNFWEQAIGYAIIVEEPTENLLSTQVIEGYDQNNEPVDPQHHSSGTTNSSGSVEL